MEKLSIDRVKEGMVMAGPAYDIIGSPIFSKGVVLTTTHINTLKSWGVKEVPVLLSHEQKQKIRSETAKLRAIQSLEAARRRIEKKFELCAKTEVMTKIKEIALRQLEEE